VEHHRERREGARCCVGGHGENEVELRLEGGGGVVDRGRGPDQGRAPLRASTGDLVGCHLDEDDAPDGAGGGGDLELALADTGGRDHRGRAVRGDRCEQRVPAA
jgi:hypothetical protein